MPKVDPAVLKKVNPLILKRFITEYLATHNNKSTVGMIGNTVSTIFGNNNAIEIEKQCSKLKTLFLKFRQDNNAIIEILIDLGNLGRVAQTNRTLERMGNSVSWFMNNTSRLCQTAYAVISYILLTIKNHPAENVALKTVIDTKIQELETQLTAKQKDFDVTKNIAEQLQEIDSLICNLASLGQTKWIVMSQKIPALYGLVDFPPPTPNNALEASVPLIDENTPNHYLPWILQLDYVNRYFEKDYTSVTSLVNFIDLAYEEHHKENGEEKANTP